MNGLEFVAWIVMIGIIAGLAINEYLEGKDEDDG